MQTFTSTHKVYLIDPANLVRLDPSDPVDFQQRVTLMRPDFNDSYTDWVHLGSATVTFQVDLDSPEAKAAAVAQIDAAIEAIARNTQEKLVALRTARNNLLAISYSGE